MGGEKEMEEIQIKLTEQEFAQLKKLLESRIEVHTKWIAEKSDLRIASQGWMTWATIPEKIQEQIATRKSNIKIYKALLRKLARK